MHSFFKENSLFQKKNKVRFTNLIPGVADIHPILPSERCKFQWFSDCNSAMANSDSKTSKCPGIVDLMQRGFIVTAPFDFYITAQGKEKFEWKLAVDPNSLVDIKVGNYVSYHSKEQLHQFSPGRTDSMDIILKVNTYWNLVASENLVFLQMPIPYPNHNIFSAVPGLIDSNKYHSLIIQLEWHRVEGTELIKAGTPLCQLIPIERHLVVDNTVEDANADDILLYKKYGYNVAHKFCKSMNQWRDGTFKILDNFRKKFNI